jgi:RNA-directed DNA polymerase
MKPRNGGGVKGPHHLGLPVGQLSSDGQEEPSGRPRPFGISKAVVWAAYKKVKANKGAAGIDGQSIAQFEEDLARNLYRIWVRLCSGSYFPPAVLEVSIPKPGGKGSRSLGVPTVSDRIAQSAIASILEPLVEPHFHSDSYGYRPGRSALQAIGMCRKRCWKLDWVLEVDIKSFFDTIDPELTLRAVRHHCGEPYVELYVKRWLDAPVLRVDGELVSRDRGSPQGSSISPLLANLFLHYTFDTWIAREYPHVQFERYCDDMVIHCASERQARMLRAKIVERFRACGLELNHDKTRVVYCKDTNRKGSYEHAQFTFLGYTFRARSAKNKHGVLFVNFCPAISPAAVKAVGHTIRRWRLHRRTGTTLKDLADEINLVVRGWLNYYGAFYTFRLTLLLRRINTYLVRWLRCKYKRLRHRPRRARELLARVARQEPGLFAHWTAGARP